MSKGKYKQADLLSQLTNNLHTFINSAVIRPSVFASTVNPLKSSPMAEEKAKAAQTQLSKLQSKLELWSELSRHPNHYYLC